MMAWIGADMEKPQAEHEPGSSTHQAYQQQNWLNTIYRWPPF